MVGFVINAEIGAETLPDIFRQVDALVGNQTQWQERMRMVMVLIMANQVISRKTLGTSDTRMAPFRIVLFTLPLSISALGLALVMPLTGILAFAVFALCVLILPLKARRGPCPNCGRMKLFPVSGFGNACKGCGEDVVLRDMTIYWLEPKPVSKAPPVKPGAI